MKIGCARVSTTDQNLDLQKDALKKAGCNDYMSKPINKPDLLEKIIQHIVPTKS